MAEEIKKVINIQVKGGDSMKLLQKEIKSLKGQLLDLEEGSEEYARVLSEVADKTLKLKDMNEAVRYSAMDMGARLQNIGRVAAGVVGGFNALQGALALFGKESEDLQKVMVKLQAGIAIVQGLQALEDLTKSIPALIANFKGFGTAVSGFFNNLFGKMDPFEKRVKGIAADLSGIGNVNLNASASASTGGNITNINAAAANKTLVPLNKMSSLHKSMIKDLQKQLQIEKARLATLEEQRAKFSEIAKEANREALKNKENLSTADLEDYIKIRDAAHKNIKETDVDIKKVKDNIKLMDAAVAQASKSTNLFARSWNTLKSALSTVGWTVAITALVTLVYKLWDYIKAANDARNAQRLLNEEINKSAASISSKSLGAFNELIEAYNSIGDSVEQKKQFLIDYKETLEATGFAITDVNTAEDAFIKNTDKYTQAIMARAQIEARREMITKKTQEYVEKMSKLEDEYENPKLSFTQRQSLNSFDTGEGVSTRKPISIEELNRRREELLEDNRNKTQTEMDKLTEEYRKFIEDQTKIIAGLHQDNKPLLNQKATKEAEAKVAANAKAVAETAKKAKEDELKILNEAIAESEALLLDETERQVMLTALKYDELISLALKYNKEIESLEEAKQKEISNILLNAFNARNELEAAARQKQLDEEEKSFAKMQERLKLIREIWSTSGVVEPNENKYRTVYTQGISTSLGLVDNSNNAAEYRDKGTSGSWLNVYQSRADIDKQFTEQVAYNDQILELTRGRILQENKLLNEELSRTQTNAERKLEIERMLAANQIELDNAVAKNRESNLDAALDHQQKIQQAMNSTLSVASSVTGSLASYYQTEAQMAEEGSKEQLKASKAYKAFAITQAIIDTFSAANAAYSSMAGIPIVGPGLGAAAAAAAVIAGIANVRRISATEVGGSSAPSISAPQGLNQPPVKYTKELIGDKELDSLNQPIQCYMVESQASSVMNKVKMVEANASF